MDEEGAQGRAFNVGGRTRSRSSSSPSTVIARTESSSGIRLVPYEEAYGEGFEELGRRRPDTSALHEMTGWSAIRDVEEAIDDIAAFERVQATRRTYPALDD